jgi:undecaprenyl-phosphate 4-deoxy-4-formamido-L-arabinose transferase
MPKIDLSVVIPVYRSEGTLRVLVQQLRTVLEETGLDYELVFVDDGSPDQSWEVLRELRDAHGDRIVAVQLMRNFGHHNALMCGFHHTRGQLVVTMDDDLQHPPDEIPVLLGAIRSGGLDLVYGVYGEKKHRQWRNLGSSVVILFYRLIFKSSFTVT